MSRAISGPGPVGLDLVRAPTRASGASKSRPQAPLAPPGELPVRGFETFASPSADALSVDGERLRAEVAQQIRQQRGRGETALVRELEQLVPKARAVVDELRRTPASTLLDTFAKQLDGAGHPLEAAKLRGLEGDDLKTVAEGLKDSLVEGAEAHLAESEGWLSDLRTDRQRLQGSAPAQWLRVMENAWGQLPPDAITTLLRKGDWQDISNVQAGARYGNVGDLMGSTVGVLHAFASGNYGDLVRLLISGSGVTGGYINDRVRGDRLEDPDADGRSNLGKALRPLQHPDRAGFLAYSPAAVALTASGALRQSTEQSMVEVVGAQVNAAGLPDIVGGLSLLAGFGAVIFLNDPRSGEVAERIPGGHIERDPARGMLMDARSGTSIARADLVPDLQVTDLNTGRSHSLGLHRYLRIPADKRPRIDEVLLRKPVFTDRVTKARNWAVDRVHRPSASKKTSLKFETAQAKVGATHVDPGVLAKATDWGRFQLFSAGSSLTTVMAWFATGDRGVSLIKDWPETAAGFAEGPGSPGFWKSMLQVGTVAATAAMTYAYTKTNIAFARAGYEDRAAENEALDQGWLDTAAYTAEKAKSEKAGST